MKNKLFPISVLTLILILGYSLSDAYSYPWFARRLVDNCNKCHVAFPKTNDYGKFVKATGYELPSIEYTGLEESLLKRFLRYLPVAVRFKVDAVNSDPGQMEGDLNVRTSQLLSGGSILDNRVSWWFHKHIIEDNEFIDLFSGLPHEMWGQYNLKFGKNDLKRVSVRYGMSELPLHFSPAKTDLSEMEYAVYNAMLGQSPVMLSSPQFGAVLKGLKLGGEGYNKIQSTFDLAFVNGLGDFSSHEFTKVFGRVATTIGKTMVSAFTYIGSNHIPAAAAPDEHAEEGGHEDGHASEPATVNDNFLRLGADFDLNVAPMFNIYGLALYGRDSNPLGMATSTSGNYYGGFLGLNYNPTERFMISMRYDAVRFGDLPGMQGMPGMGHDEQAEEGGHEEGGEHGDEQSGGGHMHGEMVTSNTDAMVFGLNFLLPVPNDQLRLTTELRLGFSGQSDKVIVGFQFAL